MYGRTISWRTIYFGVPTFPRLETAPRRENSFRWIFQTDFLRTIGTYLRDGKIPRSFARVPFLDWYFKTTQLRAILVMHTYNEPLHAEHLITFSHVLEYFFSSRTKTKQSFFSWTNRELDYSPENPSKYLLLIFISWWSLSWVHYRNLTLCYYILLLMLIHFILFRSTLY